ncbi:DUF1801 domain-containing protein [Microbacterium sp. KUDC0406]|uniref:DUF1801 domain-containing protein n=1 Tax=Microbacterium sp. KUDC0406 TaxID=2909588 RepID=UPI001F2DD27B|nr:DUF1801 domain-containing protein [Microbacterium sp. KUDC0406]UJP09523.1 DUF1801 domain-containing protein [Microbacterium sp. KUDC0406]
MDTATETTANFTDAERAAMKARTKEARTARSRSKKSPEEVYAEGLAEVQEKIAGLPEEDRMLGEDVLRLVTEHAPQLVPRTYYGMPAWANAAGKVVCFFKPKSKFKVRYATFEFDTAAALDDGNVWPVSFAVTRLEDADREFLAALIRRAAS